MVAENGGVGIMSELTPCRCGSDINQYFQYKLIVGTMRHNIFIAGCHNCGEKFPFRAEPWVSAVELNEKAVAIWNREMGSGINPMIRDAIIKGEDTTGLCTLRELVEIMLKTTVMRPEPILVTELYWDRPNGERVNVEVRVVQS